MSSGMPVSGTFGPELFNATNRYLQVHINGERLSPRQPIGSVPYAFHSSNALDSEKLGGKTFNDIVAALPPGPQGPKGDTGSTGPKGAQGEPGAAGAIGFTGPPGQQGDVGPIGPAGLNGVDGAKGDQGLIGPVGPKGQRGNGLLLLDGDGHTLGLFVGFTSRPYPGSGPIGFWAQVYVAAIGAVAFIDNQSGVVLSPLNDSQQDVFFDSAGCSGQPLLLPQAGSLLQPNKNAGRYFVGGSGPIQAVPAPQSLLGQGGNCGEGPFQSPGLVEGREVTSTLPFSDPVKLPLQVVESPN